MSKACLEAVWRSCREAISGSTLRRVRAPGALADDQNEVRFPCFVRLILVHVKVAASH